MFSNVNFAYRSFYHPIVETIKRVASQQPNISLVYASSGKLAIHAELLEIREHCKLAENECNSLSLRIQCHCIFEH